MPDANVILFFNACLDNLVCRHAFDQELMFNLTRFDVIARTLVPGWPVTLSKVQSELSDPNVAMHTYLNARSCSNECGWNQWSPNGQCVFLAPFERTSTLFVNVIFWLFILIAFIGGATFFATRFDVDQEDETPERGSARGKSVPKEGAHKNPANQEENPLDTPRPMKAHYHTSDLVVHTHGFRQMSGRE
jgi:hypothetical protein